MRERDKASRPNADRAPGRRAPFDGALEDASAKVEHAFVRDELPVPRIEWFVVDQEAKDLAIRDIDDRLPRLGLAVLTLGRLQRAQLVKPVQVRTRGAVRFALVEIAAHADESVRER